MKKKLLILLPVILAVLAILWALPHQESQTRVTFYYPRINSLYGQPEGAMGSESREVGQRAQDYSYLLALYLDGPLSPDLHVPFPRKDVAQAQSLTVNDSTVTIVLEDQGRRMTEGEYSLSCACLARTCMEITGAEKVKIISGDRAVAMTGDNLLLFDESTFAAIENTEEEK